MALQLLSHAEQVAVHLRTEILKGRWTDSLPGILKLGKELGVNHNTIDSALQLLETEGILVAQGKGRPRKIGLPQGSRKKTLRIQLLPYDKENRESAECVDIYRRMQKAGYMVDFAKKNLMDLGMDLGRVSRMVQRDKTDAWIVVSGSNEILEWFGQQPFATFAMYGRMSNLPIAGMSPRKVPALCAGVRRLVELGHSRIVMLAKEERRKPTPSIFEQAFLDELAKQGITPSSYNLPDWENNQRAFHKVLDSLFQLTPPTALFVCEPSLFIAAQHHLSQRGILAPRDVSLICDDPNPIFSWCEPAISHITWDVSPILSRVERWVDNIARGKKDQRQSRTLGSFIEGGTVGPANK
ncbi:MAG: substrate-binding domain-containing protein [Akkermansiaceae bacterium]